MLDYSQLSRGDCERTHLFEFLTDQRERLEDGIGGSGDGDNPLGAGAIGDVDLGAALRTGKRRSARVPVFGGEA